MSMHILRNYERSVWALQQAAARLRLLERALRDDDLSLIAARVHDWAAEAEQVVSELSDPARSA